MKGQNLWRKAKNIIPGGNMLLSKRAEMYLPDKWPSYFRKSKGCSVWDLEGKHYYDFAQMSVGTCTLGYANEEVDDHVKSVISEGIMSTLNCREEVDLAEKLIEIHPWSDMVRFARSGGEANAIAIRIARAATGKDDIAICGYHGWHDWYLATNLNSSKGLEEHLLPGLKPNGVPKGLENTIHPFEYNNIHRLEEIVRTKELAAVKMEVVRSTLPNENFLERVREVCDAHNIILIFDECTSGFRETFGGIHKKFGIAPDMAMFGKALGNGYAITAVIGKKDIMQAAQTTFISSTFWTERIGPTAALKTLEIMQRTKSWDIISENGEYIMNGWSNLASKYNIGIKLSGIPALAGFNFRSTHSIEYKTYLTQEMLKKGFLAGTSFYPSIAHKKEIMDDYLDALDDVFETLGNCENGRISIFDILQGPICHSGFERLN